MCDARIRPFRPINDTEVACELDGDHDQHQGTIRDYAYPGSATVTNWLEDDRRTFHGEWPGDCPGLAGMCSLPVGHRGSHVE
jgi:hypothetical protein